MANTTHKNVDYTITTNWKSPTNTMIEIIQHNIQCDTVINEDEMIEITTKPKKMTTKMEVKEFEFPHLLTVETNNINNYLLDNGWTQHKETHNITKHNTGEYLHGINITFSEV